MKKKKRKKPKIIKNNNFNRNLYFLFYDIKYIFKKIYIIFLLFINPKKMYLTK